VRNEGVAEKPRRRRTYFLTDEERRITSNGPALIAPSGERKELPLAAYEALDHVLEALRAGMGVTVTPTPPLLSLSEASELLQMSVETLREHIAEGRLPVQHDDGAWLIALTDLLAFSNDLRGRRKELLDEMTHDGQQARADEATARIPPPMR
jgi:hypothetical protein